MNNPTAPQITGRKLTSPRKVLEQIPVSAATMWRSISAGQFPKPVRIGARRVAFFQEEIDAWLEGRAAERAGGPKAA
jgi:prophage regulatory protein